MSDHDAIIAELLAEAFDQSGRVKPAYDYRHGMHRSCVIRGVAVKPARSPEDRDHNRREWDLFHGIPPEAQRLLARPFSISPCSRVLVVELIPRTLQDMDPRDPIMAKASAWLSCARKVLRRHNPRISDFHGENVGVREDGTFAAIDYA